MNVVLSLILISGVALGAESDKFFEAKVLNNPIKESTAKFELVLPAGFVPSKAKYKVQNSVDFHIGKTVLKDKEADLVKIGTAYQLHVPASGLAPGNYYLFIKLKGTKDKKPLELTCKRKHSNVVIEHAMFTVDESMEVKDPGSAGTKSLAGIDEDKDGVRDDVQRWINERFSSSKNLNAAMKQTARYYQVLLLNTADKTESNRLYDLYLDKKRCMSFYIQDFGDPMQILNDMRAKMENTKERIMAQLRASKHADGTLYTGPQDKKSQCDFDSLTF